MTIAPLREYIDAIQNDLAACNDPKHPQHKETCDSFSHVDAFNEAWPMHKLLDQLAEALFTNEPEFGAGRAKELLREAGWGPSALGMLRRLRAQVLAEDRGCSCSGEAGGRCAFCIATDAEHAR